jgi:hypothetical protein
LNQRTIERRLARAGFVALRGLDGYVPASFAERIRAQVEAHRDEVAQIVSEPPRPRGRPRKGDEVMGRNWRPKYPCICLKCGWTGKRANWTLPCPKCEACSVVKQYPNQPQPSDRLGGRGSPAQS